MPAGLMELNARVDPESAARQVRFETELPAPPLLDPAAAVASAAAAASAAWSSHLMPAPLNTPPTPLRPPTHPNAQSEEDVVGVVREAEASLRVIDADNIDEMADDILAEEEADDLLEGEPPGSLLSRSLSFRFGGLTLGGVAGAGCWQQLPARSPASRSLLTACLPASCPQPSPARPPAELSLSRDYPGGGMQR